MVYRKLNLEGRLNKLINEAVGLEMIKTLIEYGGESTETHLEIKKISKELASVNRRIVALVNGRF